MTFLDSVRAVVRRSAGNREPWPALDRLVDLGHLRGALRESIDTLPDDSVRNVAARVWTGDALEIFVEWYAPQLLSLQLARPDELGPLISSTLGSFVAGVPVQAAGASRTAEIEQIRATFHELGGSLERVLNAAWRVPVLYAEHLGLVRGGVSTSAGRMLLSLDDLGAQRWLLILEIEQTTGPTDPWRLTRDHLAALLQHPSEHVHEEDGPPELWPHPRVIALGVASTWDIGPYGGYDLTESGKRQLQAVLVEDSPMHALARALVPDPSSTLPAMTDASLRLGVRQAGRATAELARATAHELNNIVPLLEGSVEQLAAGLKGTPVEQVVSAELAKVQSSVGRLYRYVDWFKQVAEGLDRPPERFGALAALRDAAMLANGGSIEENLAVLPELSIYGLRDRFTLAVVNLLRNARQSGSTRVRLSARTEQQQLYVEVDDDGPGLPEDRVSMIFVSPFTTREDGSGQGLPLARQIIEEEHRGSIGYSRSPLGGARFTIRIPI